MQANMVELLFSGSAIIFRRNNMTVYELINKVQEEKPNTFSDEKVLSFINEIESEVSEQLGRTAPPVYTADTMHTSKLLIGHPYDRLYVSYVKAQIDFANEEYASYENNAAQHVQDFRDFVDWVVRTGQMEERSFTSRFSKIY